MISLDKEKEFFGQGCELIGSLDEAGRGPLAGPVVSACVLISPSFSIKDDRLRLINDSKKLTEKRREELFDIILKEFTVGIGICDNKTIDSINVLEATFLAMKKAISSLKQKPDFLLVDGNHPIPNISIPQKPIIGGDGLIFSIAAASIVAKVTRDRIMKEMAVKYPNYEFEKHKGYGTKLHMNLIKQFGPSPIHRMTFAPLNKKV